MLRAFRCCRQAGFQKNPYLPQKKDLLYRVLKILARLVFPLYCRKLTLVKKEMLQQEGPLLIACNHPNSFLDAIIICTLFKGSVYSLARGDAFNKKFFARILHALKMFPVYRAREGVENLEHNYTTFEKCRQVFKEGGIVLIFSEGLCVNEWKLRPLMKGTARLAISAWEDDIPLKVLPTGINYSSFNRFGKNIQLNFGQLISKEDILKEDAPGKNILGFNAKLKTELEQLVIDIPGADRNLINNKEKVKLRFEVKQSWIKKIILFVPACIGVLIHYPLYLPLKKWINKLASDNDHYDSIMVGILFLLYPIYVLLVTLVCFFISMQPGSFLLVLFLPFSAWCYVQLKQQF